MRLPAIKGVIDRRILTNYRVDPDRIASVLPSLFRPKIVHGYAIGGVCLIRLKRIRPSFFPFPWGLSSENAAHRIAVEWDMDGATRSGVYIPRRDTSSLLNSMVGGRVFPGVHHYAKFEVQETQNRLSVSMKSADAKVEIKVAGQVAPFDSAKSIFDSIESASRFFEEGSLGYSESGKAGKYDGLELKIDNWQVESLQVDDATSSFFEDESVFPKGSVEFDCALLMRNIEHQWHGREDLCCNAG